jgi:NADPH:quinone reductase-like Zn-dependent oxidoreductase
VTGHEDARDKMTAVRLHAPGGVAALSVDQVGVRGPAAGEVLVAVHAAAITRDELDWPVDRLPAIPSYEMSGIVTALGAGVTGLAAGDAVYALTGFDTDGAAAEYATVPAGVLAPKPHTLSHTESAATPLAALSAWQGLFSHGELRAGERVLIHGAAGGVGQFATQLARWCGAHVIGTATRSAVSKARELGAAEVIDRDHVRFEDAVEPVDLVFDTVGGEVLTRSPAVLRPGGRLVSVAEEPPSDAQGIRTHYFVVEPSREQLTELARLADEGLLRPEIDSVFALADARAAFERVAMPGKKGKVVLQIVPAG